MGDDNRKKRKANPNLEDGSDANKTQAAKAKKPRKKNLRKRKQQKELEPALDEKQLEDLKLKSKKVEQYLKAWKTDRVNWKFNKSCQTWIIKNFLHRKLISKTVFNNYAIPYLQTIESKGSKDLLRRLANNAVLMIEKGESSLQGYIEKVRESLTKDGKDEDLIEKKVKSIRSKYKRAKQVMAMLEETAEE